MLVGSCIKECRKKAGPKKTQVMRKVMIISTYFGVNISPGKPISKAIYRGYNCSVFACLQLCIALYIATVVTTVAVTFEMVVVTFPLFCGG